MYEKLTNPNSLTALIANAKEWAASEARLMHPYKFELDNYEPLAEQLELKEPQVSCYRRFRLSAESNRDRVNDDWERKPTILYPFGIGGRICRPINQNSTVYKQPGPSNRERA